MITPFHCDIVGYSKKNENFLQDCIFHLCYNDDNLSYNLYCLLGKHYNNNVTD